MALAVALVTLMILSVMGLAIGAMGVENLTQIRRTGNTLSLVHAANGGLHELMDRIYGNGTANGVFGRGVTDNSADGEGTYATSMTSCRYWWTFNPSSGEPYCTNNLAGDTAVTGWNGLQVPARMALLVVTADETARPGGREPVRVVALASNGYPYAIASDGTIEISDVRSLVPGHGNVRSNSTSGTTSKPNIEGDSVDGMSFSRNGPGTIDISGSSGPQFFNEPPLGLPNIPIAEVVASQSTAGLSGSHPYGGPATLQVPGPGPHDVLNQADGSLEIGGVRIAPLPASVYVEGSVRQTGGGSVVIPQGIQLFVHGDLVSNGSLNQGTTPAPGGTSTAGLPTDQDYLFVTGDMTFNGAEGPSLNLLVGGNIRQNGTSNFTGLVYTQQGSVLFNGGGTLTGSVIARAGVSSTGNMDASNLDIVFDPRIFDRVRFLGMALEGPVRTESWYLGGR